MRHAPFMLARRVGRPLRMARIVVTTLSLLTLCATRAVAAEIPSRFDPSEVDAQAIGHLLETYTTAVSNKNQDLFEAILLSQDIPFSYVSEKEADQGLAKGDHNFEAFRKGVFEGKPFHQSFRDVHINQDGPIAQVSLTFVNDYDSGNQAWGWKILQLIRVKGQWKLASELFTYHP